MKIDDYQWHQATIGSDSESSAKKKLKIWPDNFRLARHSFRMARGSDLDFTSCVRERYARWMRGSCVASERRTAGPIEEGRGEGALQGKASRRSVLGNFFRATRTLDLFAQVARRFPPSETALPPDYSLSHSQLVHAFSANKLSPQRSASPRVASLWGVGPFS